MKRNTSTTKLNQRNNKEQRERGKHEIPSGPPPGPNIFSLFGSEVKHTQKNNDPSEGMNKARRPSTVKPGGRQGPALAVPCRCVHSLPCYACPAALELLISKET